MPINFLVDEIIHNAIMKREYEKAKAIALGELVKTLRDIWGEIEAIKDDGISLHSTKKVKKDEG